MQEIIYFIKEFEGIIGAVLGAVATLIVTDILKGKGKLKIYLMNCNNECIYHKNNPSYPSEENNKVLKYCNITFKLDVYNSSESPKIMRNIKLKVYKGNKLVKELDVYDEDTKRTIARCTHMDKANIFNINAKESYSFNLLSILSKELVEELKDGLILKLNYKNEKNKDKYFEIFNGKIEGVE